MLAVLAVLLAAVPLLGGSLTTLSEVRLGRPWALPSALLAQIIVVSVFPHADRALLVGLHLASYGLAALFLHANRKVPGLSLLALGATMNFLAIAANGGVMPARPEALASAGIVAADEGEFVNSGAVDDAELSWLGDVFAVPEPVPLHNVFSIGDVLIVAGAGWTVHRLSGAGPTRRRDRRPTDPGHASAHPGDVGVTGPAGAITDMGMPAGAAASTVPDDRQHIGAGGATRPS